MCDLIQGFDSRADRCLIILHDPGESGFGQHEFGHRFLSQHTGFTFGLTCVFAKRSVVQVIDVAVLQPIE